MNDRLNDRHHGRTIERLLHGIQNTTIDGCTIDRLYELEIPMIGYLHGLVIPTIDRMHGLDMLMIGRTDRLHGRATDRLRARANDRFRARANDRFHARDGRPNDHLHGHANDRLQSLDYHDGCGVCGVLTCDYDNGRVVFQTLVFFPTICPTLDHLHGQTTQSHNDR